MAEVTLYVPSVHTHHWCMHEWTNECTDLLVHNIDNDNVSLFSAVFSTDYLLALSTSLCILHRFFVSDLHVVLNVLYMHVFSNNNNSLESFQCVCYAVCMKSKLLSNGIPFPLLFITHSIFP